MEIIDNRRGELVFRELHQGNVFIDAEGNVLMKTASIFYEYNAVSLNDGEMFKIPGEESVTLLKKVKLVIED